jgi:hypothetical protein
MMSLKSFKGTQACHTVSISTTFLKPMTQAKKKIKSNSQHQVAANKKSE